LFCDPPMASFVHIRDLRGMKAGHHGSCSSRGARRPGTSGVDVRPEPHRREGECSDHAGLASAPARCFGRRNGLMPWHRASHFRPSSRCASRIRLECSALPPRCHRHCERLKLHDDVGSQAFEIRRFASTLSWDVVMMPCSHAASRPTSRLPCRLPKSVDEGNTVQLAYMPRRGRPSYIVLKAMPIVVPSLRP
jgi:hypothetical protein